MEITNETWKQTEKFPIEMALEWNKVLPITEDWKGKKILDFGSGSGRDALLFAKEGADVYCVDILQSNLNYAKELFKKNNLNGTFILIKENDILPFEDNFFDGINCNGVLHHIPHANEVVIEFSRVIKPKGISYIMLYTEDLFKFYINNIINEISNSPEKTWQRCFGEMTDKCKFTTFYTVWDACQLFVPRGFGIKNIKTYHHYQFRIFKLESIKQ
jgi:ubiquinone/menaquinone biosynthesis C-methylase UbiE